MTGLEQTEPIVDVSFSKTRDERDVSITNHPAVLERSSRLVYPPSLAKLYQYGYQPSGWNIQQGGDVPKSVESPDATPFDLRQLHLRTDPFDETEYQADEQWFDDAEAVREFAARVSAGDVDWAAYIPWFRTTTIPTYRLSQAADTMDWSGFPDRPGTELDLADRFDTTSRLRVGDFIRMAVLQKLERSIPSLPNLSTGPDSWTTNRISMVIEPTSGRTGLNTSILCPRVVLRKLADYGYRPIDAWYTAPVVGHGSDDPPVPRRLEFARGHALQSWYEETRMQHSLFDDAEKVNQADLYPELEWETLVQCSRSQIITYRDLRDLTQTHHGLF